MGVGENRSLKWLLLGLLCLPLATLAAVGSGTGFFITPDGYIATNYHVIAGATEVSVRDSSGRNHAARVVRTDMKNDLAILKVEGRFPALALARSNTVRKGDSVFTLGFPNPGIQGLAVKFTEGTVSSLSGIQDQPNVFQMSVPIQPGNSGGPLLTREGVVVGVVVSKLNASFAMQNGMGVPDAVNYSVKSNYLLELVGNEPLVQAQLPELPTPAGTFALADLIAAVEPKVVFILAKLPEAARATAVPRLRSGPAPQTPPIAQPTPLPPTAGTPQPRYERDAEAQDAYQNGRTALQESRWADALRHIGRAASLDLPEAQAEMGVMYAYGIAVVRDDVEAVRWLRLAVDKGNPTAQAHLGWMTEQGRGLAKDQAQALRWYQMSADKGNAVGQYHLGRSHFEGVGVSRNPEEGIRLYRLAASQGLASAQAGLGLAYSKGEGLPKDNTEALHWCRLAADQGNTTAQNYVGRAYLFGLGVNKDLAEAVRWTRMAAEKGDAAAQNRFADMLQQGQGVARDDVEAVKWARLSARQGNPFGQSLLGFLTLNGRGVPRSVQEALHLFRLSAEQNNSEGQNNLGWMYANGSGVPKNEVEAVRLYRLSVDQGNKFAQNNLADMLASGRGVERDEEQALRLYRLSAAQGNEKAQASLKRLTPTSP
jgi:TPR repeat protein